MSKFSIKRAAVFLMVVTIIEKILGFVREMIIASQFGATGLTDSYIGGYLVPNFIMVLLSAGFVNIYIPVFMSEMEADEVEAWKKINSISTYLIGFLLLLTIGGIIFSKQIMGLLYPGFSENSLQAAISVSRIFFIGVFVYSISIIETSILSCFRHFAYHPISISLLSIGIIIWVLLFGGSSNINSIAYGYLAGAIAALILQYIKLKKLNGCIYFNFKLYKEFTSMFLGLLFPILIATSMSQMNVFVDRIFASYLSDGSMSFLSYADKVTQLPIVFFSGVISTVIFPDLIEQINKGDKEKFRLYFNRSMTISLMFLIPSFVGIAILNREIVKLIFERNAFDSTATLMTASALIYYSPTIVLYGIMAVVSKVFYSIKDSVTLMYIGIISILLNAGADYIFMKFMGHRGLALATSMVAVFQVAAAYYVLTKKVNLSLDKSMIKDIVKICMASFTMAGLIYLIRLVFGYSSSLLTLISIGMGALIYLIMLVLLKNHEAIEFVRRIKVMLN